MLTVKIDETKGIVILVPDDELSVSDFKSAAETIDPFIEKNGHLNGIVVHVKSFPGWDSFSSLIKHLKFVKEHHKKVSRVAFATQSPMGSFAEHVASHFVNAKVKSFPFNEFEAAKEWVVAGKNG